MNLGQEEEEKIGSQVLISGQINEEEPSKKEASESSSESESSFSSEWEDIP